MGERNQPAGGGADQRPLRIWLFESQLEPHHEVDPRLGPFFERTYSTWLNGAGQTGGRRKRHGQTVRHTDRDVADRVPLREITFDVARHRHGVSAVRR